MSEMGMVESSPEKAGVGGSIPSLATIVFKSLATPLHIVISFLKAEIPLHE